MKRAGEQAQLRLYRAEGGQAIAVNDNPGQSHLNLPDRFDLSGFSRHGKNQNKQKFLVLFLERTNERLLFEKRSKNFPDYPLSSANLPER
jgi:hypothetical protein